MVEAWNERVVRRRRTHATSKDDVMRMRMCEKETREKRKRSTQSEFAAMQRPTWAANRRRRQVDGSSKLGRRCVVTCT